MAEINRDVRVRRRRRGGCLSSLFNILTAMIIVVTILALLGFVIIYFMPGILPPQLASIFGGPTGDTAPTPTLVPVAILPSPTNTLTPAPVLEPTWTLPAPQATEPPPPTNTRRPAEEPTVTLTLPPNTPTRTPTATPTDTATPGPSPTTTFTRSPFPFTKTEVSPQYLQNFANNAGCNWLGIGGEVLDLNLNPVAAGTYRVHVWDNGIDQTVNVGSAPDYGPSGWEVFLFNAPRVQDHNVQLETANGTAVSQVYRVQTRASCNQNLVLFTFAQNH
jgi:hypothetical protein